MENVLYVGGGDRGHATVSRAGSTRQLGPDEVLLLRRGSYAPWSREYLVRFVADAAGAAGALQAGGIDVLVIDHRGCGDAGPPFDQSAAFAICSKLVGRESPGMLDRVFVLLGPGARAVEYAFGLGRMRVGDVLYDPSPAELFARIESASAAGKGRKVALCLAGGGIEGLIYELGVLRALETFLPDRPVVDFDMFVGISVGAFIGAFLANGVGPDELARGLGDGSGRIDAISRADIFDLDLPEYGRRLYSLAVDLMGQTRPRRVAEALLKAVPAGIFSGRRIESYLERQLTRPGMTNAFGQLRRPLYVGVTDQDTSDHVVLGAEGHAGVPISRAVRASAALAPFYPPVRIHGRNYVDGGFTRTLNLSVAVEHGAGLVIAIDPLIPVDAEPGHVEARGGAFEAVQGLKSFMQSRFVRSLAKFRELHPEVAVVELSPEGEETRLLSGSMMRYFYRTEVLDVAFEATVRKLRQRFEPLSRDFARHGLTLRDPTDAFGARSAFGDALDRGRLAAAI